MSTPHPAPHTRWPRVVTVAVGVVAVVSVIVLAFLWPSVTAEPRGLPVAVVGEPGVLAQVGAGLDQQAPGALELVPATDRDDAVGLVETRDAYGALVLGPEPEVLTAAAASPAVAQLLTSLRPTLQTQVDVAATAQGVPPEAVPTVAVTDVVPLSSEDPRGSTLAAASFPLVLGGAAGGIAIALAVVGVWRRVVAVGTYAAVGGLVIAGILHGLGGLHGAYLTDALAVGLTLLGIAGTVVGAAAVLGRPGVVVGAAFFLLVANPISASALPAELLLAPWGAVGQWLPPGASATLLRALSYFPAADTTFAWLVLTGWAALGLLLTAVGRLRERGAATASALREAAGDDVPTRGPVALSPRP